MTPLRKILQPNVLIFGIFAIYLFFGLQHITRFVTADEHYWVYERIPQYWDALENGKWRKTFINDKPGVSLALVSGIGLLSEPHPEKRAYENHDRTLVYDGDTEALYRAFRLPVLVVNGLLLLFLFWIIGRLTDPWIALWATMLAALSPILLGISQIVNPDALLWSFGAAALFSYFALLRFGERKYLFLTIFFTGFALLTKYVAFVLLPFYLALILFRFFSEEERNREASSRLLKKNLASLAFISLGSLAVLCLFLPALLIDPKYLSEFLMTVPDKDRLAALGGGILALLLIDTFALKNRLLFFLRNAGIRAAGMLRLVPLLILALFGGLVIVRNFFPGWDIFTLIPFDIKNLSDARYHTEIPNFFETFLLEWTPFVFSLTPIALAGIAALLAALTRKKTGKNSFLAHSLLFFALAYSVLFIFSNVLATPRYGILLYPLFALLAAIGIRQFSEKLRFRHAELIITAIVIFGSLASLYAIKPFYFNYANALLPQNALIHDAWGYGGYEAAQYLNTLPDAKNLTVWIDYYGVCEFFVGKCLNAYTFDSSSVKPDYYVLTRRGQIRYMSRADRWERLSGLTAYRYYGTADPDWQLLIDGRPGNFIKVVKVDKEVRIPIITDIDHCPSREAVSEEKLHSFIAFGQERNADSLVSLGDNASHRLRNCSKTGDADARYIADTLRSSGLPVHLVLGDHDIASAVPSYQAWMQTVGKEKTYYSFQEKDVHVVVLDTVLGGEPMRAPCKDDAVCSKIEMRLTDIRTLSFAEYREKYADASSSKWKELAHLKEDLKKEGSKIDLTRSFGNRDRGRVSEEELEWLRRDLEETPLKKVVIFSDHPLFPFASSGKRYDIMDGDKVRAVLEQSGKEIVAISGEAHLWHEETLNGIRYYIVDEFRKAGGSWAYATWDTDGFKLEKITHEN